MRQGRSLAALLLTAALLLALPGAAARAENAPETVTVRLIDPEQTREIALRPGEAVTLGPGPEIEGYTFLGWQNAWSGWERRESVRVGEDTDYVAIYAMALGGSRNHEPYLPVDEAGAFHPDGTVTRREAAVILYGMMNTALVGDGRFLDVKKGDACYKAAATLKTLGAVTGSRFHPDETITRGELLELLGAFYPAAVLHPTFDDLDESDARYPLFALAVERGWFEEGAARPDAELTRREAAHIFNLIDGRRGDDEQRGEMVGTVADVSRGSAWYWDVVEAAIPHEFERVGENEHWTASEPLPLREPGMYFEGVRLHAIDETGDPAADAWYEGIYFNAAGEASTGLPALDEKLWDVMAERVDPATMLPKTMLWELYNYTAFNFQYSGEIHHEFGETGWEAQDALDMLTTGRGNCYSYAGLFACMARMIGYDARAYSGRIWGAPIVVGYDGEGQPIYEQVGMIPHAWVEIDMDGTTYLFDPEMQMANMRADEYASYYKQSLSIYKYYGYEKP